MSEGSVYPDTARHERPAWIGRLKGSGKLESALVAEAGARPKTVYYLLGHTAIVIGAFLLIGALANAGRIVY